MTVTEPGPCPAAPCRPVGHGSLRTRSPSCWRGPAPAPRLTDAVDEADLVAQHSPLMSPLVWDLAHVGNQEELWLVRDVGGREPLRPEIDGLYDAFQHSPGQPGRAAAARPGRGARLRGRGARQGARRARAAQPAARAPAGRARASRSA